ncbi:hypothetical protein BpHYR1_052326 [Brachionus plicatilis]|uniref:Uncharacterized protein n=1 Tax=Brachionus plicatilis TaxID=10195 RepID=A0A3M7T341_BRAPC|nr:hypothetical protein BpHYR1_052326 [Brachionus plicatilis]
MHDRARHPQSQGSVEGANTDIEKCWLLGFEKINNFNLEKALSVGQPKQVKSRGRPRKVKKDEDELFEHVIDVETGVESAKENKRGRLKKLKTALEREKPKKRRRPPKSKK